METYHHLVTQVQDIFGAFYSIQTQPVFESIFGELENLLIQAQLSARHCTVMYP
jgi:hypothetical protein